MTDPALQEYLEIRVELPNHFVEAFCDFVVENLTTGLVLEEEEDASQTTVIFYLPDSDADRAAEIDQFLVERLGDQPEHYPTITKTPVEAASWIDRYRESVELIRIADDLVVRPTWVPATDDKFQLVLEPKMAFGTGSHATTRSSLLMIRKHFQPGTRFLDMGCGSGILSILADQMGASYIKAIDYDLAAAANCEENFELNGVQTPHDIVTGSIDKCDRDEPYDFIAANIIRTTILAMLRQLLRLTKADGWLVLSGLLDRDEEAITAALTEHEQTEFKIMRDEGWLTYSICKR